MYFKYVPRVIRLIYPNAIWTNPYANKMIWTYDDGPHPESTPSLLNCLKNHDQKGMFFCLGEQALLYPHLIDHIRGQGHIVASHGMSHIAPWNQSFNDWKIDFHRSLDVLETAQYRPPYGRMTIQQYRYASKHSEVWMWTIMPGDFDPKLEVSDMLKTILARKNSSDIVVLHDSPDTLDKNIDLVTAYAD